jgi:hypothetical protein
MKYIWLIPAVLTAIVAIVGGLIFAGAAWLYEQTPMRKYWSWDIDFDKIF